MAERATEAEWTTGYVESNGVRHHYLRTGGDGPPLVVAHGVTDDGASRTPLVRDLAERYDVIAYDARGHGRSDAPESGYEVADRADDLVGLVDALDLEDPLLVGHSMGGDTVAATAADHPDLPRAVVLVDPACMLTHAGDRDDGSVADEVRERVAWWHDHATDELLEADDEIAEHVANDEHELARLIANARVRVSPNVAGVFEADWLDAAETFSRIDAPTLVLRADVDGDDRERDRERAAAVPNGRLVHVDGAGHTVFRDERERAMAALRNFLDGV